MIVDGVPDTAGLPCDRLLASDGAEYMRRYYLGWNRSRFHHIVASDPGRDFHDHPWDFVSRLLVGSYIEHTPSGEIRYTAPCVIVRRAESLHRLELADGDVWSYVVHGRVRRTWGFMTDHGWLAHDRYDAGSIAGCADAPRPTGHRRHRPRRPAWLRGRLP